MANPTNPNKQSRNQQAAISRRAARKRAERKRNLIAALIVLAVLAIVGSMFIGASGGTNTASTTSSPSPTPSTSPAATATPMGTPVPPGRSIEGPTPCPKTDGTEVRASSFSQAPPLCIDPSKKYTATLETNQGNMVVALDTTTTPLTTNNFVVLSRYKYYDGSAIVRTSPGIDIIQGGAPTTQTNSDRGPGYNIPDEGLPATYSEGDMVMANTGRPNSSGAQWFIGAGPGVSDLPGQYIKFGKLTSGLDLARRILSLHVQTNAQGGAPSELFVIEKVTITES